MFSYSYRWRTVHFGIMAARNREAPQGAWLKHEHLILPGSIYEHKTMV